MTPGNFWDPPPGGDDPGSVDMQISSGYFPLEAGQTERIAMAIMMGNDQQDAIRNKTLLSLPMKVTISLPKLPIHRRLQQFLEMVKYFILGSFCRKHAR